VRTVRDDVGLPVIAAGGLATAQDIAGVIGQGADAVLVGTILLLTDESGASETYKAALAERSDSPTLVTRAFSGRPARAIPNRFTDRFDGQAPPGYPAIHHLTTPLRRAAAGAGDPELINLWAGANHHLVRAGSTASTLSRLAADL
jgi:NAD(P)H-dependent flavin oxidoreductase YrpB (nitropropane dioxygenase family)